MIRYVYLAVSPSLRRRSWLRSFFASLLLVAGLPCGAWAEQTAPMRSIEATPASIAQGLALFGVCAGCHGMNGEGRSGIAPRLNSKSFLAAASDEMLINTISKGRSGSTMVPWGAAYNREMISAMVSYMRSWNEVAPAELDESPLNGDAAAGAEVFASICAACHGKSGGGYMESANGTGIGRAAFVDSVSNGFVRYLVKHGKSNTPMRPFSADSKVAVANLSDKQIDDVIAFLRANAW